MRARHAAAALLSAVVMAAAGASHDALSQQPSGAGQGSAQPRGKTVSTPFAIRLLTINTSRTQRCA